MNNMFIDNDESLKSTLWTDYINKTKRNKTMCIFYGIYRKASNIRRTLVGDENVDHTDVVGASPAGAAPATSSFSN